MSNNITTTEPVDQEGLTQFTDWMTDDEREMMRRVAKADGRSMSQWLRFKVRAEYKSLFGNAEIIGKAASK